MLLEVFSLVSRVAIIFLSILHQHAKEIPVELEINIRNASNKQLREKWRIESIQKAYAK